MANIGIFGGSFNPIHKGHILLAKNILRTTDLEQVWFLISPLNPFKTQDSALIDNEKRYEMAALALAADPDLIPSRFEFDLPQPSYTWYTLQQLQIHHPEHRFTLIIGADNWLSFHKWAHPDFILAHFRIFIYPRNGYKVPISSLPQGVRLLHTPLYPISATQVREEVAMQHDISTLVPENIIPLVQRYYAKRN